MEETKKLPYESPELTKYGSIEELTETDTGNFNDLDGFSATID